MVTLADLTINRCISCGQCNTKRQYLRCVHDDEDDVRSIFTQMEDADIIIYATPVYVFTISGLMKIFLERMYALGDIRDLKLNKNGLLFHHTHPIGHKPFVTLVCCDNIENETPKNVLSYFRTYAKFKDAEQIGTLVRNAGVLTGRGKDPEREKRAPKIFKVYKAYVRAGHELAAHGHIRRSTQRCANQEIVPMPMFGLLKRFKKYKKKVIENALKMQSKDRDEPYL